MCATCRSMMDLVLCPDHTHPLCVWSGHETMMDRLIATTSTLSKSLSPLVNSQSPLVHSRLPLVHPRSPQVHSISIASLARSDRATDRRSLVGRVKINCLSTSAKPPSPKSWIRPCVLYLRISEFLETVADIRGVWTNFKPMYHRVCSFVLQVSYSGDVQWTSPNRVFVHFQDSNELTTTSTSITISPLVPSTIYVFKVSVITLEGQGAESMEMTETSSAYGGGVELLHSLHHAILIFRKTGLLSTQNSKHQKL